MPSGGDPGRCGGFGFGQGDPFGRKNDRYDRPLIDDAGDLQCTAVQFGERFRDRQAGSGAAVRAGIGAGNLAERFQHGFDVFFRDAVPMVASRNFQRAGIGNLRRQLDHAAFDQNKRLQQEHFFSRRFSITTTATLCKWHF